MQTARRVHSRWAGGWSPARRVPKPERPLSPGVHGGRPAAHMPWPDMAGGNLTVAWPMQREAAVLDTDGSRASRSPCPPPRRPSPLPRRPSSFPFSPCQTPPPPPIPSRPPPISTLHRTGDGRDVAPRGCHGGHGGVARGADDGADLGGAGHDAAQLRGGDVVDGRQRVGHQHHLHATAQKFAGQGDHAQHDVGAGVVHKHQHALERGTVHRPCSTRVSV